MEMERAILDYLIAQKEGVQRGAKKADFILTVPLLRSLLQSRFMISPTVPEIYDRVEEMEMRYVWWKTMISGDGVFSDEERGLICIDTTINNNVYPAYRFANKLARIPGLVECAKELLKSLNEDGDTGSPNDAFQNLWENEAFKKMLVNEYRKVRTLRGLINKLATEDRVEKHEARMAWVKEDPVLGTDVEDDADLMRKVLSLSVLYWMDIKLYNIVDLREVVLVEMPDDLTIDYTVESLRDEVALRKQIDACMENYTEAEREVAFKEIRVKQLQCESSLAEGVGVRWLVSYNPPTQTVPDLGAAVTKPL
ncbi:hypothetical protein PHJA_000548500 [Phtheirospermum japonicum]|uniref:Uncharacterized protein n=1 Tax=Phtheirospermum japonicum TaxID=374723 RepID=A0A830BFJ8_9LAMI|nr:hypothetical protein PHJA_000548500 [Phtheirospermum japonicum]